MSQPWHQASCRRPDVTVAGGTPFCSACDALADCTSVVSHSGAGIPRVPDLPPGGIRNLSWPSSVPYHQDDDYQPSMGSAPGAASVLLPANPATNLHASQGPYAPLETSNHIRLLRLSKGDLDDPIHGVLITASLDDNSLDFEALSYAWADESGDASRRKVTYIGRFWDMLPVTANCFAALRHMRRVKHDILVWVDAICINQGNHTERNSQVGLMTRIYSSARELFVYLGEGDSQLEAVVGALGAPFRQEELADPDLIQALFRCRYFSRMWIIQEVANAKTAVIHYGAKSARWAGLAKTRLRSLLGPRVVQSIPTWITAIYNQPRHNAVDLPRLLHITASSEAADPRDRIFALFGLLTDAASHGLVADYNLALPEVLTGYAAFVLLKLNQPWMLDRAVCNNAQQLPTWVPEWQEEYEPIMTDPAIWGPAQAPAESWLRHPGSRTQQGNSDLRISSSGCLTIPAVTLIDSCDGFELHWARKKQAFFGRGQSHGMPSVPPGKAVVFRQANSIFYLESTQTYPSQRYRILFRIPLDSPYCAAWLRKKPGDKHDHQIHDEIRKLIDNTLDPMLMLDRAVTGALGRKRRSAPGAGPPWWELEPVGNYEMHKSIKIYSERTSRTPDDMMLPALGRLDVWGGREFWRDVDEATEIWSAWHRWLELTSQVAGLLGRGYVDQSPSDAPAPRDPERKQLLARWARDTCSLAQCLAGQTTNPPYDFYQVQGLKLRIGELLLDFLPAKDTSLPLRSGELLLDFLPARGTPRQLSSGMEPQELEDLVWETLDSFRGEVFDRFPTRARASDDDVGWDVWNWSSLTRFVKRHVLPVPEVAALEVADGMRELFSRVAFLRAVLSQEIVWEDVTIC